MSETALLEVDGISKHFRGLRAVDNVSFTVKRGGIVALIGPNGAGKTTVFNLIAGVFRGLSVCDNVLIGALRRTGDVATARRAALAILERIGLADKAEAPAHSLTLAERKRLETARALATEPKILLLDEVMAGLRPVEIDRMVAVFAALCRDTGLTILLTEHVMRAVMALSHHIVVLHHGRKICEGAPEVVARDPRVLDSYLGGAEAAESAPC